MTVPELEKATKMTCKLLHHVIENICSKTYKTENGDESHDSDHTWVKEYLSEDCVRPCTVCYKVRSEVVFTRGGCPLCNKDLGAVCSEVCYTVLHQGKSEDKSSTDSNQNGNTLFNNNTTPTLPSTPTSALLSTIPNILPANISQIMNNSVLSQLCSPQTTLANNLFNLSTTMPLAMPTSYAHTGAKTRGRPRGSSLLTGTPRRPRGPRLSQGMSRMGFKCETNNMECNYPTEGDRPSPNSNSFSGEMTENCDGQMDLDGPPLKRRGRPPTSKYRDSAVRGIPKRRGRPAFDHLMFPAGFGMMMMKNAEDIDRQEAEEEDDDLPAIKPLDRNEAEQQPQPTDFQFAPIADAPKPPSVMPTPEVVCKIEPPMVPEVQAPPQPQMNGNGHEVEAPTA